MNLLSILQYIISREEWTFDSQKCKLNTSFPILRISSNDDNGIEIQQQAADSPIIAQETGDITAMEKITKLKTQWLSQLP